MARDKALKLHESFETTLSITEEGYLSIMQGEGEQVLLSQGQVEALLRYYERHENDMSNRWDYGLVED